MCLLPLPWLEPLDINIFATDFGGYIVGSLDPVQSRSLRGGENSRRRLW